MLWYGIPVPHCYRPATKRRAPRFGSMGYIVLADEPFDYRLLSHSYTAVTSLRWPLIHASPTMLAGT